MMKTIEFQARVTGNVIEVPAEFKAELGEGDMVTVVVRKETATKTAATGIIAELLKNPVKLSGVPFSREALHDRNV